MSGLENAVTLSEVSGHALGYAPFAPLRVTN